MSALRLPTLLFLLLLTASCAQTARAALRDTISINRGWLFHAGEADASFAWNADSCEQVNLPHDFQISQPWIAPSADERPDSSDPASNVRSRLSARAFKEMGIGWYRRTIRPDEAWRGRRVVLDFQGIMLVGDVYLNGERIAGTDYGYLGFDVDITHLLRYGEDNVLTVRADTRSPENSRWYTGGGLFRDVNLIVTDAKLYLPRHPLAIRTTGNRWVDITAEVVCRAKPSRIPVEVRILDASGREVAKTNDTLQFNAQWRDREYPLPRITWADIHPWSCETPVLYTAEVTLFNEDGQAVDCVSEPFGVRTVEFTPERGLLLNGQKVLLKGFANHHTLGALGAAAFPRAIEKRLRLMKAFGYNHVRTSHSPYSEDFLRLCDRLGLLVVDELYDKWLQQFAGGRTPWENLWQHDVAEWVTRDRNHPSVVMWSLGNELQQRADLPFNDWGVTAYRLQRELLRRYDETRPVTVAMHPRYRDILNDSLPCPLARTTDVASYNYRYGYFPTDGARYPNMIFYQSEASTSGMGENFFGMDTSRVAGLAYWGAIDYLGESMGWPAKGWMQGVFTTSLEPKPDAWLVKSMFSAEPTVHIALMERGGGRSEWNGINVATSRLSENWTRSATDTLSLFTFTNAEEVELTLNGRSLGVKRNSASPRTRNRIRWDGIPYSPGRLTATARSGGKVVAQHTIETTGEAVRLKLEPDTTCWHADGTDLMHVRITAVDRKGRRVWNTDSLPPLRFALEGDATIAALDNGNLLSNESFQSDERSLFNGTALAVLRAGTSPSKVRLTVSGLNGKKQTLVLQTR